ncbi:hypothetical protein [Deinococcus sp.]|uniref:hypothetical protein n=1 Tax=Deinococcus sp. TaxID=47478 RepID=UPI003C7C5254
MPLLTCDEFRERVALGAFEYIVDQYLLGGDTYIFEKYPEDKDVFYSHVCGSLEIEASSIHIVGSAKLGFSCAPHKFGREFNVNSDIDVVIIDANLFDKLWHKILEWTYSRRGTIEKQELDDIKNYRKLITKGFLMPETPFPAEISGKSDFNINAFRVKWQNALKGLSANQSLRGVNLHDAKARLYRTVEHAKLYHIDGLKLLNKEEEI